MSILSKLSACLVLAAVGCGDDGGSGINSGLSDSQVIASLTSAEQRALCEEARGTFPSRQITCADNVMVTIGIEASDCGTDAFLTATCPATVGNVRDCADAMAAMTDMQFCMGDGELPAACAPLNSCM